MPLGMVLALAFFSLMLGYVVGNFLPMLKNNPLSQRSDPSPTGPKTGEARPSDPSPPKTPSPPVPPGMLEIARLHRKEGSNQLVAEIDSSLITKDDDLTSDQHALLSLLLLDLSDWIGIQSLLESSAAEAEAGSASKDEESSAGQPGFSPVDMFKKALQADVVLPSAEISLADQIDPILQGLLESSPLAGKGIRLMDIEGRGMTVVIGLDLYNSVEDVPDPEIKGMIRKAVSIWESRLSGNE
ncbi:MAG: hypothetical protein OEV06_10020 [Anaerolineae bacterium]|nr:hypothetical protein [Anaerolineae bacterium]